MPGFETAGGAEQMPGHRFRRGDRQLVGVLAEQILDRERLDAIVVRRRRAVRVDVADLLRRDVGLPEGHVHDAHRPAAVLGRRRNVIRVAGHAVADDLGVDSRAARDGRFALFENDHAGPLADDEPIALLVERAARFVGLIVARRHRAHRGKPADAHRRNRRLRAAGNHRVGVAAPDDLERLPDRMRRRRARGAGRQVRPFGAEADRHLSCREVDDGCGNEERRDLPRPSGEERLVLALDAGEPADAGAHEHADVRGVRLGNRQLRVIHRELRGRNRVLDEDVHLLDVLLLDELQRIESLDFARDPRGKRGRVEARDLSDAALARRQARASSTRSRCPPATPARCR